MYFSSKWFAHIFEFFVGIQFSSTGRFTNFIQISFNSEHLGKSNVEAFSLQVK